MSITFLDVMYIMTDTEKEYIRTGGGDDYSIDATTFPKEGAQAIEVDLPEPIPQTVVLFDHTSTSVSPTEWEAPVA